MPTMANVITTPALPKVIVKETADRFVDSNGFVEKRSNVGILGTADFKELPFNVVSFSKKAIESYRNSATSLIEVVTLDPTVTSEGNNSYNDVRIKGCVLKSQQFSVNGIPGLLSPSSIPTDFVERIDVISGPNLLWLVPVVRLT